MEMKFANGERVLVARVQQKNEGDGNAAGRKSLVKLSYVGRDASGQEKLMDIWVAFWNGKPGDPQLYTRMKNVQLGEWIVVKIVDPSGGRKEAAALEFLQGDGALIAAVGTNAETTVVVGTPNEKGSRMIELDEGNVYEAVVAVPGADGKAIWHKIQYGATKKAPEMYNIAKSIVEQNVPTVFVFGKTVQYEGKANAFVSRGYLLEPMPVYQPEPAPDKLPETPDEQDTVQDIKITIGIHAVDQPMLSTLTSTDDFGWMRSVIKYYTRPTEEEKLQIEAMKNLLANK